VGRREVHLGVWWRNLKDEGHLKDICRDGRTALECFWKIQDEKAWMGVIWLRIGHSSRLL
jgi:hypothetical protein